MSKGPRFGVDFAAVKEVTKGLIMAGKHAQELHDEVQKAIEAAIGKSEAEGKLKGVNVGLDPGRSDITITAEFVVSEADADGLKKLFNVGVRSTLTAAELAAADKVFDDE